MQHFILLTFLSLVSCQTLYTLIGKTYTCNNTCRQVFYPTAPGFYGPECNSSLTGSWPGRLLFSSQDCADLCTSTYGCEYFKTLVNNTDLSNGGNAVGCVLFLPIFNKTNPSSTCTYKATDINLGFYAAISGQSCDHSNGKCITSPVPSTVANCGIDYTDSSFAMGSLLLQRKDDAVRVVEEAGNINMNALDKIMFTNGIYLPNGTLDPDFCSLVQAVLNQQNNASAMSIFIDNFYSCDFCTFVSTWNNLAKLYAYRKRFKANFVLMNYTDVNCVRNVRYYSVAGHFGQINYLPGNQSAFNSTFPGPAWHTTYNFFDTDRFQIEWTEQSPNVFKILAMIQQTEGTWPLGNEQTFAGFLSAATGAGAGRSPLPYDQGGPGDLPLPAVSLASCPSYAQNCLGLPPRTTPCPTTFTL